MYDRNLYSYEWFLENQKKKPQTGYNPNHNVPALNALAKQLYASGGFPQQDRMIRDKRKALDRAVRYSYQAAKIKKYNIKDPNLLMDDEKFQKPVPALINPDKLKQDYDDKILSVGFEYNFKVGDIFEWMNTGTYWLICLQDLTELAYFRGDIRKCSYQIEWVDEDGNKQKTMAAVRGPVETKINYIQKHGISVDTPNYSLNILIPQNEETLKYFKRYSKFYLQEDATNTCWRVEAVNWISNPNIIELNAVEYYANETEDDIENGLVGALKAEKIDPNEGTNAEIIGETFIKPKKEYEFIYIGENNPNYKWIVDKKYPVKIEPFINEKKRHCVKLKWESTHTGQFELSYGPCQKTIVVESLF